MRGRIELLAEPKLANALKHDSRGYGIIKIATSLFVWTMRLIAG